MFRLFRSSPKKILVVEDNAHNHDLYRTAFSEAGFEVLICSNADGDFIDTVVNFQPQVISMDLMIGQSDAVIERDGFAAIVLLQADPRTSTIPVIVVSNFFQDDKIEHARSLGVVDYFNLQGLSIRAIANRFAEYVRDPRHYKPSHPLFR